MKDLLLSCILTTLGHGGDNTSGSANDSGAAGRWTQTNVGFRKGGEPSAALVEDVGIVFNSTSSLACGLGSNLLRLGRSETRVGHHAHRSVLPQQ